MFERQYRWTDDNKLYGRTHHILWDSNETEYMGKLQKGREGDWFFRLSIWATGISEDTIREVNRKIKELSRK